VSPPKYSLPEFERRFLVGQPPDLSAAPHRLIEDLYIEGTRLRLRAVTGAGGASVEYKLCKKYASAAFNGRPIVNIYLSADEYALLAVLEGRRIRKRRYRVKWRSRPYGIDVFDGELAGLILCEVEATCAEALAAVDAPPWAVAEVTDDLFFAGDRLARLKACELQERLAR
jgi:CYTH domain-containing protein